MAARHVALIGMPACGKSAAGRALGYALGIGAVDLDSEVEQRTGRTPAEILRDGGEADLRRRETEALRAVLDGPRSVVACGGGVIASEQARELLAVDGVVSVWLTASLDEIARRCREDAADRPLLDDPGALTRLWHERRRLYLSTADLVVATDGRDPDAVAATIAARLAPESADT